MLKKKIESMKSDWREKCKPWILENRTYSLGWAVLIGMILALVVYWVFFLLKNDILRSSLTILALGLPTFFTLWLFRTHDVQRQIDKTEENTNNSTFFESVKMLTDPNPSGGATAPEQFRSKKIALEQLAYLRKETGFAKKRIDLITQGLPLRDKYLLHALLSGLDLSGANLMHAYLEGANLSGANLNSADLRRADLSGANLSGANLIGAYLSRANLSNIIDDDETKWEGASFDNETKFDGTSLESIEVRKIVGMVPIEAGMVPDTSGEQE